MEQAGHQARKGTATSAVLTNDSGAISKRGRGTVIISVVNFDHVIRLGLGGGLGGAEDGCGEAQGEKKERSHGRGFGLSGLMRGVCWSWSWDVVSRRVDWTWDGKC